MGNYYTTSSDTIDMINKTKIFQKTIHDDFYGSCDLYQFGQKMIACKKLVQENGVEFKPSYGF